MGGECFLRQAGIHVGSADSTAAGGREECSGTGERGRRGK